jgi:CRISPR-associated protein Cas1
MKRTLYIFSDGKIYRSENTLFLETKDSKKSLPINAISDIQIFGEVEINKKLLEFLTKNKICVHFFNRYGYYIGSYYPREFYNSGFIILEQARHYLDIEKRLFLARSFVLGAILNIIKNLKVYNLDNELNEISNKINELKNLNSIEEIMAFEGNIRKNYYQAFNKIIKNSDFEFDERVKNPPNNPINALISFGNSLLYITALSQIYRTYLDPRIGYLHETNFRSFSLNLDISEVFKPIIVDRVIFSLLNKRQINLNHFLKELNSCYLNEEGAKIFVKAFEEKLNSTITYRNIGKVSYRRLIRIECYKLYKHFIGEEDYKPFVIKE